MVVTVDLLSVLTALLIMAGIALAVWLIVAMSRLIRTLGKLNQLLDQIENPVVSSVRQMPDLMERLNQIASQVSVVTDSARTSVPPVLDDVRTVTSTVREGVTNVSKKAQNFSGDLQRIFPHSSDTASSLGTIIGVVTTVVDVLGRIFPGKAERGRRQRRKSRGWRR
jgi:uncharacterized protein YoxC